MTPKLFAPLTNLKKPTEDFMYHHCSVGHQSHQRMMVDRDIYGVDVTYQIYDWREYFITVDGNETVSEHGKYCTGQDIISYCIDKQKVWEAEETALQVDILREQNHGIVLDFGSHIGYYSILAAKLGYDVAAFDSSQENLALLHESAELNQVVDKIHPYYCLLDEDVPKLNPFDGEVHLAKIDIEGAEQYAVKMLGDLLVANKLKYLIMEVSPVFNDTYPDLVEKIAACGYDVYQIPSNLQEPLVDPLKTVVRDYELKPEGRREYITGLHQENLLFVRRDNG